MVDKKEGQGKTWGWFILYLFLVILGQQLAGIGGVVGGFLIAWGISRTVRNQDYSNGKKILYSVLYVIGGVVLAILIVSVLIGVIYGIFGAGTPTPSSGETTTQPPIVNTDTSQSNISTSNVSATLEGFKYYKNADLSIQSMPYPENWLVNESLSDYQVVFSSPQQDGWITSVTYGSEEVMDLNAYFTALKADAQKPNDQMTVEISNDKIEKINGKDWLLFDATVDYGDVIVYERIALVVTGAYGGKQYVQIMLETYEDKFPEYADKFSQIVNSTIVS